MTRFLKCTAAIFLFCLGASYALDAQNKDLQYYNTHESAILPDAQAAFKSGRYDRAVELCKWFFIIVGDTRGDALRDKAQQCAKLSSEMNELIASRKEDEAKEKAGAILTINPDDRAAKDAMASIYWVDLGLPSGKLWKASNEEGLYNYNASVSRFKNSLPSKDDIEELKECCEWLWTGHGYRVTGPNGASVDFPTTGWRDIDGQVSLVATIGNYRLSTSYDSGDAWVLAFDSGIVDIDRDDRRYGAAVRLVRDRE